MLLYIENSVYLIVIQKESFRKKFKIRYIFFISFFFYMYNSDSYLFYVSSVGSLTHSVN